MASTADIDAKFLELRGRGIDLGAKLGAEQDAHPDGRVQIYDRGGRIYWHPNTGAHEVHGGILLKYLSLNGPGVNPNSGRRDFGFPISDEIRTADGLYPISHFEFGSIVWGPVGTTGGVGISGDFRKVWEDQGRFEDAASMAQHRGAFEHSNLGYPITDHVQGVAGGEAIYFQRGCFWKGPASLNVVIVGHLAAPLLSTPKLINPDQPSDRKLPRLVSWATNRTVRDSIVRQRPGLFEEVWRDRLVLQRVAKPGEPREEMPLLSEGVEHFPRLTQEQPPLLTQVFNNLTVPPDGTIRLQDRNLYNLGFRLPRGGTFAMAPHAFYAKRSWDNFGFIHATDLHVSRRLDGFRRRLRELGLAEGAKEYTNFNDNFRELIRYANALHDSGSLDFVMATGDLVDYVFEDGDNRRAGGNFAFLEQLILGRSPSPETGVPREELRVPIFTTVGNHDYRINPYFLLSDLDVPLKTTHETVDPYLPHNLTEVEALALQGGTKPLFDVSLTSSEADRVRASRPVVIDKQNRNGLAPSRTGSYDHYFQRFTHKTSYTIRLGPHRIVMLDSGPDVGIPEDLSTSATIKLMWQYLINALSEDTEMSMNGSPNSEGVGLEDLQLVSTALAEAGSQGLVIIGIHAPPLNPQNNELAHYFRETEHSSLALNRFEVEGFLQRHTNLGLADDPTDESGSLSIRVHIPQAQVPNWPFTGTPFFKKGGIGDLLDYGISRDRTDEFLRLCAGVVAPRKVDLVLCGHHHDRVDYRLGFDGSKQELLFHHDFYTENPQLYYRSLVYTDTSRFPFAAAQSASMPAPERVHVQVQNGAPLNGTLERVRDSRPDAVWKEWLAVRVPPYATALNSSTDTRAWWNRHRPLILQTSALGPMEANQRKEMNTQKPNPSFQGVRVVSVANNIISKVRYERLADVRNRFVFVGVVSASAVSSH